MVKEMCITITLTIDSDYNLEKYIDKFLERIV